jgi:hypothetical protein
LSREEIPLRKLRNSAREKLMEEMALTLTFRNAGS